jgi:hypothetical protein
VRGKGEVLRGLAPGAVVLAAALILLPPAALAQPPAPSTLTPLAAWPTEQLAGNPALQRPGTQILVTLDDPNAARLDLSGRPGPRYQRRGAYRVSTDVRRSARRLASEFRIEAVAEWPIRPLQLYCLVFHVPDSADLDALLEALNERAEVRSAEPLNVFETRSTDPRHYNDPFADLQHAVATLQLAEAHRLSTGRGAEVTIIDTGADLHHPELRGRITRHRDFVSGRRKEFASDRHGTALAGVIGAAVNNGIGIVGIAPDADIQVLKACWHSAPFAPATCNSFTLAQALSHAIESGTRLINLSLAGPRDTLLSWLVEEALARNIAVVAAAPERGGGTVFPSNVDGVIIVDRLLPGTADSPAAASALRAPGDEILVTVPDGGFDFESGTSLAAAHVTGIAALLIARDPVLSPRAIHALLAASRDDPNGSVNACRALAALLQRSDCEWQSQNAVERLTTTREPAANPP